MIFKEQINVEKQVSVSNEGLKCFFFRAMFYWSSVLNGNVAV